MKVVIPTVLKNEYLDPLGISEDEVIKTANSDNKKIFPTSNNNELLFLRKMENGSYLLIAGLWKGGEFEVRQAYRLFEHLIIEAQSNDPFVVLQTFAHNFGLVMRSGEQQSKFIYGELIHLDASQKKWDIATILGLKKDKAALFNIQGTNRRVGNETYVVIRIAYAIDREKYLAYVKEQMADL